MMWLMLLTGISGVMSLATIVRLLIARDRYGRPTADMQQIRDLPSVSVCIPARNEAHAMSFCLERVLQSDYQKLEVLVLDDNSSDDTSLLIKSFAHAGVRFIPGKELPRGWLGKNHALDTMAREASGEVILFLDVDTQICPTTISRLVRDYLASRATVLSVIPMRRDVGRASVLFGHLRYFWEFVLATKRAPACASALVMVSRDLLLARLGGFASMRDHVQPERTLASWAAARHEYTLLAGQADLGVYYEKRWSSQRETSQRLLLPMMTSSLATVVLGIGNVSVWLCSIAMIPLAVMFPIVWAYIGSMLALSALSYYVYLRSVWTSRRIFGVLFWPYVMVQEIWFALSSVVRYLTKTVTWKGRSVKAPTLNRHYLIVDE